MFLFSAAAISRSVDFCDAWLWLNAAGLAYTPWVLYVRGRRCFTLLPVFFDVSGLDVWLTPSTLCLCSTCSINDKGCFTEGDISLS